ncbi:hypothetical protein R3P38DRAFT_2775819 [Favolaschia claudopus]|uniref:Uncharacterized protein n=1 Tax=Favolaschia claudopus TaxID=2862362 RepID=A0AAW0BT02_9AGAR
MARANKRQNQAKRARQHHPTSHDLETSSDDENVEPSTPLQSLPLDSTQSTKRTTIRAQLTEKEARITELEATLLDLTSTLQQLQHDFDSLKSAHASLEQNLELTSAVNKSLKSLKRKADTSLLDEQQKQRKRVKRMQSTRDKKAITTEATISTLTETIDGQSHH